MELRIPPTMRKKLKDLEKADRERIEKKLDEIDRKVSELQVDPEKAIEKRLRGPLHPKLQQRVGDWRLWFEEGKERDVLWLKAIKRKEEAEKYY